VLAACIGKQGVVWAVFRRQDGIQWPNFAVGKLQPMKSLQSNETEKFREPNLDVSMRERRWGVWIDWYEARLASRGDLSKSNIAHGCLILNQSCVLG
jgi:hypothetical protein